MNNRIISVVLVDDHVCLREGIAALLSRQPDIAVVAEAAHGKELIDKLKVLRPLPQVAIIDINMPVMNGYETAAMLSTLYPSIKIIAFSYCADEYSIIRMIRCGATGYLNKAIHSGEDIYRAIREVDLKGYHYADNVDRAMFSKAGITELQHLTVKETEFLGWCCEGYTNKKIAEKMYVSFRTVEHYSESLSKKLGVSNRLELVIFAIRNGLVN